MTQTKKQIELTTNIDRYELGYKKALDDVEKMIVNLCKLKVGHNAIRGYVKYADLEDGIKKLRSEK